MKTATLLGAGAAAALLSIVPTTAAAADALPTGTPGVVRAALGGGGDDGPGPQGPQGPQGPEGPQGPQGELDTYVVTGPVGTSGIVGTEVTSTALCLGNDVAVGGGFDTSGLAAIEVQESAPVFTGTGPATGWRATATVLIANGEITAYAVCHDVE